MQHAFFQHIHRVLVIGLIAILSSCASINALPPSAQDNNADSSQDNPSNKVANNPDDKANDSDGVPDVAIATPQSVEQRPQAIISQVVSRGLRQDAQAFSAEGLYSKAERLLDRAIRIAPRDAENYYELAKLRLLQQQPAQATQLTRRALSLHPDDELYQKLRALETQANNASF